MQNNGIRGEIVIGDNGSTDGSQEIAKREGARVVAVKQRGYGAALLGAIKEAKGKYIIMGDSDDSYDFLRLEPFMEKLRQGNDLVMGNRFTGGIEKGAMPFLHKHLGNPVLSFIARLFFNIKIGDFNCGLRGFRKEAVERIGLITPGMEFAFEMIVKSSLFNLKITEVPTKLHKDGRSRPPHLRTWRDGWRDLRFLLLYSPRWLFFYPGLFLFLVSSGLFVFLIFDVIGISDVYFDVHTMTYFAFLILFSTQLIGFYFVSKIYAVNQGLVPINKSFNRIFTILDVEKGMWFSFLLIAAGIALFIKLFLMWKAVDFKALNDLRSTFRILIPSVLLLTIGVQSLFLSFIFSTLGIIRNNVTIEKQ